MDHDWAPIAPPEDNGIMCTACFQCECCSEVTEECPGKWNPIERGPSDAAREALRDWRKSKYLERGELMDRETLADILTNEEPDSYVHGERTFRDWMLEYADRVLEKYEEHEGRSTLTFAWREGYEAGRRDKSETRTIVNPYVDGV